MIARAPLDGHRHALRDFTPAAFTQLLAGSKRPLKDFLLDQTHVAGIGNIYSCESLWHARLDPRAEPTP